MVGPPSPSLPEEEFNTEYTFAHKEGKIIIFGIFSDLSSVAGAFAVAERICRPHQVTSPTEEALGLVRLLNTNTDKLIHTAFSLGPNLMPKHDSKEVGFSGIPGKAWQIMLDFINPGGAKTAGFLLREGL